MKPSSRLHPRHLLPAAAMLLAFSSFGCKSNTPDDPALTASVQAKLQADGALAGEAIHTSVQDAVATLSGSVSSPAARSLAANDVAQVAGLRTVVNNLTIQTPPAPAEQQAQTLPPPDATPAPPPPVSRTPKKPRAAAPERRPDRNVAPIERAPAVVTQPTPPPPPVVAQQPHSPPPPAVPAFRDITLPAGTIIPVRIGHALDSATTQQGEPVTGTVATDVITDGLVAIPQGSTVSGRVDTVQEAAHYKGNALLVLELTGVNRRGERLSIVTEPFSKEGSGRGRNTAEKVGGGAAVGAILGGIFGGGRGAAIGAAAGGGAGAGVNTVTRGQQVQIPSETLINFKLSSPLALRVRTSPATHTQTSPGADQDPSLSDSPAGTSRRPLPPGNPQ